MKNQYKSIRLFSPVEANLVNVHKLFVNVSIWGVNPNLALVLTR